MAEVWYLSIDTESLEDVQAQREHPFHQCIELLEITPDRRECEPDVVPDLKTGNPLVDQSGYVYVMMRVTEDDLKSTGGSGWEPGWYKSSLTIVGYEKKLRKKPK